MLDLASNQHASIWGNIQKERGHFILFSNSPSHKTQVCKSVRVSKEWGHFILLQILLVTQHKHASLWVCKLWSRLCCSFNCTVSWHRCARIRHSFVISFLAFLDVFMQYGAVLPSPSSRPLQLDWVSKLSASWRCSINSTASHSGAINHAGFEFYSIYSVIIINICTGRINNRERTFADKVADSIVQCHSAMALSRRIWHSLITKCQVFSICGSKFHFLGIRGGCTMQYNVVFHPCSSFWPLQAGRPPTCLMQRVLNLMNQRKALQLKTHQEMMKLVKKVMVVCFPSRSPLAVLEE